ncbi:MAG TPA: HD domain-containing protein [Candidatus Acidoferrum sp.]|nr:HD domain-containing protein [Candidatus Acidoferrum sp.]
MLNSLQNSVDRIAKELGEDYADSPADYSERKIIRDTVWGFHDLSPCFLILLDSPYMQRLRHIHQTALAFHTYPSATHSRFEHSVGAWHISGLMLEAIDRRKKASVSKEDSFEVRAAALLHDSGNGPFSHVSEDFYGQNSLFDEIKKEDKKTFLDASPSEILSWCLLHSPSFNKIWKVAVESAKRDGVIDSKDKVSIDDVGRMILGASSGLSPELRPLKDIVNGPFDADKLDYMIRDARFTGLRVPADTDRLLWGIRLAESGGEKILAVDASSTSALEQIIFGKAQLYTQIYHHHKVRAAARLICCLLEEIGTMSSPLGDLPLDDPASFLALDDFDLLNSSSKSNNVKDLVKRIKLRRLPKRCLVITKDCITDDDSASNWSSFKRSISEGGKWLTEVKEYEKRIADYARTNSSNVMIDVPIAPKLAGPGHAQICFPGGVTRPLSEVFPAEGWANAHEAYRSAGYIFVLPDSCRIETARDAARKWLKEIGVDVNPYSWQMAKVPNP